MIPRHDVVSAILGLFPDPSYLEIGVNKGETFRELSAARKIAVDPHFMFDIADPAFTKNAWFFEVTSDAFFAETAAKHAPFDVIYLDGLHTVEQTLRDLMNAISVLSDTGVIVIDDVLPSSYDASLPDFDELFKCRVIAPGLRANWFFDGSWMGDVFKLVFFIETFLQPFSFATIADNHGQTVLWRHPRASESIPHRSLEQIGRLDYRDSLLKRDHFNMMPFAAILQRVELERAFVPRSR